MRVRLTGKPHEGKLDEQWQTVSLDPKTRQFQGHLALPAGGWYRLELQAVSGGMPGAMAAVEHVGVGEVFVVAGQSNSTNYGSERQRTATGMVSSFDGSAWRLADDPQGGVQDGSKGGSFLPAFGDALVAKYKAPVGVASVGCGATSVRQWLKKGEKIEVLPTLTAQATYHGPKDPSDAEFCRIDWEAGKTYEVTALVEGPHIKVAVDRRTVIDYWERNGVLASGGMALGLHEGTASFSKVSVNPVPAFRDEVPPHVANLHFRDWKGARWAWDGSEPIFFVGNDCNGHEVELVSGYRAQMQSWWHWFNYGDESFYADKLKGFKVLEEGSRLRFEVLGTDNKEKTWLTSRAASGRSRVTP